MGLGRGSGAPNVGRRLSSGLRGIDQRRPLSGDKRTFRAFTSAMRCIAEQIQARRKGPQLTGADTTIRKFVNHGSRLHEQDAWERSIRAGAVWVLIPGFGKSVGILYTFARRLPPTRQLKTKGYFLPAGHVMEFPALGVGILYTRRHGCRPSVTLCGIIPNCNRGGPAAAKAAEKVSGFFTLFVADRSSQAGKKP
jgi:hypothetical protein